MDTIKSYVSQDQHGVMRVGETRVMLDSIVAAFHAGHSAETIAQQYPGITLEAVYGAIAYYLSNRSEIDQYLQRQNKIWEKSREQADQNPSPVVQRLRSQMAKSATDAT